MIKLSELVCSEQTKKDLRFFQPNGFAFFHLFRIASSEVEKRDFLINTCIVTICYNTKFFHTSEIYLHVFRQHEKSVLVKTFE